MGMLENLFENMKPFVKIYVSYCFKEELDAIIPVMNEKYRSMYNEIVKLQSELEGVKKKLQEYEDKQI